eukprot:TRINITY_DN8429_c0_g3_i6.p1 TRINITY_DN8429_c0_g3~~TRINITY_DN8429_c0_g3_i6.p1  ORF type:complete len:238 (+),score=62.24 TRINITY_DN8429_c0_g3_i6:140-853(+)
MGNCRGELRGCCGNEFRGTEYEFADANLAMNYRLSITDKKTNNEVLVKHIRSIVTSKEPSRQSANTKAKLQDIVKQAPLLIIKVLNGNLPAGTVFRVNAQGAEQSLRGASDGITYFGCKKRSCKGKKRPQYEKEEIVNDIVIKSKDKDTALKHRGRHFLVEYSLSENAYLIKDLGVGYGAYVKLVNPLVLKDNMLLSMGESFFIANLLAEDNDETNSTKLRIKVFSGPSNGEVLYHF